MKQNVSSHHEYRRGPPFSSDKTNDKGKLQAVIRSQLFTNFHHHWLSASILKGAEHATFDSSSFYLLYRIKVLCVL